MNLQCLTGRNKSSIARLGGEQHGNLFITDFQRARASIANQEWNLVRLTRMVAAYERVDRLKFVDEAVLQQKIQRAIDRRRRGDARTVLEMIEQIVGLDRNRGLCDQFEYAKANRGEAQSSLTADP